MQAENIDLFEQYHLIPPYIKKIFEKVNWFMDTNCNKLCASVLFQTECLGYTFDYGLDGVPIELRKMNRGEKDFFRENLEKEGYKICGFFKTLEIANKELARKLKQYKEGIISQTFIIFENFDTQYIIFHKTAYTAAYQKELDELFKD